MLEDEGSKAFMKATRLSIAIVDGKGDSACILTVRQPFHHPRVHGKGWGTHGSVLLEVCKMTPVAHIDTYLHRKRQVASIILCALLLNMTLDVVSHHKASALCNGHMSLDNVNFFLFQEIKKTISEAQ